MSVVIGIGDPVRLGGWYASAVGWRSEPALDAASRFSGRVVGAARTSAQGRNGSSSWPVGARRASGGGCGASPSLASRRLAASVVVAASSHRMGPPQRGQVSRSACQTCRSSHASAFATRRLVVVVACEQLELIASGRWRSTRRRVSGWMRDNFGGAATSDSTRSQSSGACEILAEARRPPNVPADRQARGSARACRRARCS